MTHSQMMIIMKIKYNASWHPETDIPIQRYSHRIELIVLPWMTRLCTFDSFNKYNGDF